MIWFLLKGIGERAGQLLVVSMCITRGISFYLVMIISFAVWGMRMIKRQRA